MAICTVRNSHATVISELSLAELGEINVFTSDIFESHLHNKNEWMFIYHYTFFHKSDLALGEDTISDEEGFKKYQVVPSFMDIHSYMFHLMYSPTSNLTLSIKMSYLDKEMKNITKQGNTFISKTEGINDASISLNYKIFEFNEGKTSKYWYGVSQLNVPTGSIDEKTETAILPYTMQLGSGSYRLKVGLGYTEITDDALWGSILSFSSSLKKNNANYKYGDDFQFKLWYQREIINDLSFNFDVNYFNEGSMEGEDLRLDRTMSSTADYYNYGFKRIDLSLGFTWLIKSSQKMHHIVGIKYTHPLWQDVQGIQLQTQMNATLYWQTTY